MKKSELTFNERYVKKKSRTPEISNDDKIKKHGYDKWSFKKKGKNSK